MSTAYKRLGYAAWVLLICGFAALYALHLQADFPNHSPWYRDWAKYTDEGWYSNAATRAHLFGQWYLRGDFNPAAAVPLLPALEWLLFFVTGVSVGAARGLAVGLFFCSLLLSYLLLRVRGPAWVALLAVTLLVTSPFLYSFSRLALLEPVLTALMLAALNLAVRLPHMRRPAWGAVFIGLLYTLMLLTKTTAVFLLPALGWAIWLPLRKRRTDALRRLLTVLATSGITFAAWMALLTAKGLLVDYRYLIFINTYPKPSGMLWPAVSLWWSLHGTLWADHILEPLAAVVTVAALAAWRTRWGRGLLLDPVFGAAVLTVCGYLMFMTYQDHPQPRYFALVFVFSALVIALGAGALVSAAGETARAGWAVLAIASTAAVVNGAWTVSYAAHPEYTYVTAARELVRYIDEHPNGRRLLVSISGDEIALMAHLPTLCDDFSTPVPGIPDLPAKIAYYQPGWYAAWNDLDPGTLADLHSHFTLEQVARFHALDDPDRNVLVLFKLHPLAPGMARGQNDANLRVPLPGDKIDIPIE